MLGRVRHWRSAFNRSEYQVAPSLPESDRERLRAAIAETIDGKGGEVAARRRATEVGDAFLALDGEGRQRFFELLANEFGPDSSKIADAIDDYQSAADDLARSRAAESLQLSLQPSRVRLFRRFIGIEGGLGFLVDLREELLPLRRADDALAGLDTDLRRLLGTWFDVGLLRLERLTWDTPAALLEKLIDYEAVHAIESWDDLKARLSQGRRCYAFVHPAMEDDPLIFVEIALVKGMADDLAPLLDPRGDRVDETKADTAIFYSISNCHQGLAGVPLGDFLIKRVVQELSADLPGLSKFATLSPIPGFRTWLAAQVSPPFALDPDVWDQVQALARSHEADIGTPAAAETQIATQPIPANGHVEETAGADTGAGDGAVVTDIVVDANPNPNPNSNPNPAATGKQTARELPVELKEPLLRLCAHYLVNERHRGRAADPVAHFHLSNGARIERINWGANTRTVGWERSLGLMVNYRYQPDRIEKNYDAYVQTGEPLVSDAVAKLLAQ